MMFFDAEEVEFEVAISCVELIISLEKGERAWIFVFTRDS